ncbi:uncharacterized protein MELLADRAFT_48264 [Melampsora larici-populina 98AG31]|uniref:HD/PDEase domain-containing protein n=1 Tax=Melampsora larici-populina (strain 98AG31 / pathotype 3-4-7) TaxID=747676 RepID=F4RLF7_MELLP|nr:uncharacterized protein MELLADRAFT_48264 [Melampsora larici-populina 98AG31]EGG07003.1 hypothetical protein MELLADRAFT_48264 [Melampsora larici-populina 98AG31]
MSSSETIEILRADSQDTLSPDECSTCLFDGTPQSGMIEEISTSDDTDSYRVIDEPIYGTIRIDLPCAIEIMELPTFQRLKKVLQHGITALIGCVPSPAVNRFDHSVGAMLLVKRTGGTEEAQLAALLHDVAHTTLSHVLDLVYGYVIHEVDKPEYIASTPILEVLTRHGFDPERVLNEENFRLLELPKPDLCADRLDYSLRDSVAFHILTREQARSILESAVNYEGQIVLNSIESASLLANAYLSCDEYSWANPTHEYLYQLCAKAIRESLNDGHIDKACLWKLGDEEFWSNLASRATPEVRSIMEKIDKRCKVSEWDESTMKSEADDNSVCELKLRVRTIDPLVLTEDGPQRLSCLDPDFAERREKYIKSRETVQKFVVKYTS